ncbi:hypothetical protein TR13x_03860 [Caloranaerobacter sp. TR13]|uniref:hypothetical protein n=1 Tax=Caloranaerobacter sp. TR13 TaxID=1302151 RepID=UPI0006D3BD81|nr:hypothetical protein [Caloranaerobacter sp. TR13]KPU27671.1 hypothetical protein TR13x_03860 [Caloranaerobacter sp. TR13]
MKNQEIEVIVNTPGEEILQEMIAKAIASIVIDRINGVGIKQRKLIYKRILEDSNNKRNEDICNL